MTSLRLTHQAWPDVDLSKTDPILRSIKERILASDREGAQEQLYVALFADPSQWGRWPNVKIGNLLGLIRNLTFSLSKINTACVDLRTGDVWINPRFFLIHINKYSDLVEVLLHEREHRVIELVSGKADPPNPNLWSSKETAFALDAHANCMLRSVIPTPFIDNFYLEGKSEKELSEDRSMLLTSKWRRWPGWVVVDGSKLEMFFLNAVYDLSEFLQVWEDTFLVANADGNVPQFQDTEVLSEHSSAEQAQGNPGQQLPDGWQEPDGKPNRQDSSQGKDPGSSAVDIGVGHKVVKTPLPDIMEDIDFAIRLRSTMTNPNDLLSKQASLHQHMDLLSNDLLGDLLSASSADTVYTNSTPYPAFDRRTKISLSCGHVPVVYYQEMSPAKISYTLYVDVSGSMQEHYPLVRYICKVLQDIVDDVVQFSTFVHKVLPDEQYAYTSGGTDFDCVLQDIEEHGRTHVIVLTDDHGRMTQTNVFDQLYELHLIKAPLRINTGQTKAKSFSTYATSVVDLPKL